MFRVIYSYLLKDERVHVKHEYENPTFEQREAVYNQLHKDLKKKGFKFNG